jgi:hypothetical protein
MFDINVSLFNITKLFFFNHIEHCNLHMTCIMFIDVPLRLSNDIGLMCTLLILKIAMECNLKCIIQFHTFV